jgi:hypothetical protein
MNKINRISGVLLLFSLLIVAAPQLLAVNTVNATNVASEWGHLNPVGYDPSEYQWESMVTGTINSDFPSATWNNVNYYWASTTQTLVDQRLQFIQNPITNAWATTWWVGDFHGSYNPPYPTHYEFYGDQGDDIWDSNIFTNANSVTQSKSYFNFIWTCTNGGLYWPNQIQGITYPPFPPSPYPPARPPVNTNTQYGYVDDDYGTGVVGMPYAWTGTTSMNLDGYTSISGSYCYIGFENESPFLKDVPSIEWSSTRSEYGYFAYYFYRYALGIDNFGTHGNIHDSLDYAAKMTFGHDLNNVEFNFGRSVLNNGYWYQSFDPPPMGGWWFCRMRVLGNGALTLPY